MLKKTIQKTFFPWKDLKKKKSNNWGFYFQNSKAQSN